jgi:hypothetical protein
MSSINPNNINGTYPIAGQDNDSQGFRDNFTNVKNNLAFAKNEIEDLQNNALLKGALSGTTLNNELGNAQLKGVQCLRFTNTIKDLGTLSGIVTASWQDAHYQVLITSGAVSLAFTGWPTSGFYTTLRLQVTVTTPGTTGDTLTLPTAIPVTNALLAGAAWSGTQWVISFAAAGTYYFDFTTYDGGATIAVADVSRNYVAPYQYSAPVTDFNTTITPGSARVIFDPAGTLAKGTITLPTGNVDATTVTVSSTQIITAFKTNPSTGTTLVPSANVTLAAGTSVSYFYHASEAKWYKID